MVPYPTAPANPATQTIITMSPTGNTPSEVPGRTKGEAAAVAASVGVKAGCASAPLRNDASVEERVAVTSPPVPGDTADRRIAGARTDCNCVLRSISMGSSSVFYSEQTYSLIPELIKVLLI